MSSRILEELIQSFGMLAAAALKVTVPLTIISFIIGIVIALMVALVQIARIPVLKQIARFYVWIIRGTPMIVQLFVVYFGLPSIGITLPAFPSAVVVFFRDLTHLITILLQIGIWMTPIMWDFTDMGISESALAARILKLNPMYSKKL